MRKLSTLNTFFLCVLAGVQFCTVAQGQEDFSIIVLPDTQIYARDYPQHFAAQTQWIKDNATNLNIKCVLHLGDITDNNVSNEWDVSKSALSTLDGVIPYALALGNHDYGTDGTSVNRDTLFNNSSTNSSPYFGPGTPYTTQPSVGGFYPAEPERTDNSWHTFHAEGDDYLVLALEFAPRDLVVEWADTIVSNHPNHRVILITHSYLYPDSTRLDWAVKGLDQVGNPHSYLLAKPPNVDDVNDGEELWQKLVKKHDNFIMAMNGHHGPVEAGLLTSLGDNGNVVHQMFVNYQFRSEGGDGYLRILTFKADTGAVEVKSYSPVLDQYYTTPDQKFTLRFTPNPVIDLTDHLDGGNSNLAIYAHALNGYQDVFPEDDQPDDAYYANNVWLDGTVDSIKPGGWQSTNATTGWVVWGFDAPYRKEIATVSLTSEISLDPVHCAGSSATYYYSTNTFVGIEDPDLGSGEWIPFGTNTVAGSGSFTADLSADSAAQIYIACELDRVVVAGQTANYGDFSLRSDSYQFNLVDEPLPVINLAGYATNGATSATFGHMSTYVDYDPDDERVDDAYYTGGAYLKEGFSSGIYAGNTSGGSESDSTAWVVWAFDAPDGETIKWFDFYSDIHLESTVADSTYTYYYNVGEYDGLADPTPGANGWTQFTQMGYGDDAETFPNIMIPETERVYIAFKIDRVVNAGGTANWWDDQQQRDNYVFHFDEPQDTVIDLTAYMNDATSASYDHLGTYPDADLNHEVDDAYYDTAYLKGTAVSGIYAGNTSGGPESDSTAWVVWAFDAPTGKQIAGFDFWTDIHIEATATNSSYTYYYNTGAYDGFADPSPGANGWTQFAQMGWGDDAVAFPDIAFAPADRVYVAFEINRVVNAGGTANWWDDQQQRDSYGFDLVPQAIDLTAYTNGSTSAIFGHMGTYVDVGPDDDVVDDSYYASGGYLKPTATSSIYSGSTTGGSETDRIAWVVWGFDAPADQLIAGFDFYSDIALGPFQTNSTFTYYYNAGVYDGLADPTPGANGWTQFAQMGWGDNTMTFPNIAFDATDRVYVAFEIERVVFGGSAGWWYDQQQRDNYEFDLVNDAFAPLGTPEWWMVSHGLTNDTFAEEELLDGDTDGLKAWQEWVSDTDPTDSNSVLQVTGIEPDGAGMKLYWKGGVQATQVLEQRTNLVSGTDWAPVFTNIPPTSTTNSLSDSSATNRAGFYRIKAWR